MQDKILHKKLSESAVLHTVSDTKYKTEYLSLFFSLPLTERNATFSSLTARVLQRGSASYPTMKSLSRALDANFASSVGASAFKCGEREIFSVNLVSMKEQYALNGEKVFSKGVEILTDVLFNPVLENGGFVEEYFLSERENLKDSISAQINNKASYARIRFIANMCEGEPYAVNGEGNVSLLENVSSSELYDFYKNTILSCACDIYYVGEKSEEEIEKLLKPYFPDKNSVTLPKPVITSCVHSTKRVSENIDIAQGHLLIGYRTGITYSSDNYLSAALFNMVLGGDVTSRMFMNLREKMSLCYSCHSSLDASKGILVCYAGIDPSNAEVCESAFYEQLEKIKAGEISSEELSQAKLSYANRMREIADNPSLLPMWHFMRKDAAGLRDPERDALGIQEVTREDVMKIANEIELDTVYLLSGKGDKE